MAFFSNPGQVPSPLIGKEAPDFTISHIFNDSELTLNKKIGKPIIINFWASWCVECQREAHILERYHQHYEVKNNSAVFIGIAIQDTPEAASRFARRFGKSYFLGLDDDSGNISIDYGIFGVPETFFVDKNGIIKEKHIGALTSSLLEKYMKTIGVEIK